VRHVARTRTRTVRLLGHDFFLECDDHALVSYLDGAYAHLQEGEDGAATSYALTSSEKGWTARVDGSSALERPGPSRALEWLVWRLNQGVAASAGSGVLLLHAGMAVAGSRGVLLPAPPDSGKSTLTTGLADRGLAYGGDEFVRLDLATGLLGPVPRPPVIEGPAREIFQRLRPACREWFVDQWLLDPNLLRGGIAREPVRAELVVVPRYIAGAPTVVEELPASDALVLILKQSFNLRAVGRRGLAAAADIVRSTRRVSITSGDLGAACDAVEGLLDS
jgi:hypothetical protein